MKKKIELKFTNIFITGKYGQMIKKTHRYKIYCIRIKMCGGSRMVIGFEGE